MYQPANWETRAARYRRFHWRNESARDLTCCRNCVVSFSLQVTEANGRPPRNFEQWPTAQRWPTAPYQQATEFKPPQQVPSGKPPGQDIFRRQQTTGQQQLPPKGYTGSRVVQPTTTKQLIRTVGPTGATAMTVAVPQPPSESSCQPPSQSRYLPQPRSRRSPFHSHPLLFSSLQLPFREHFTTLISSFSLILVKY